MRLILVRHAQTASNAGHVLDSRPPGPPLTEEGRRQAAETAKRLAAEPVRAVYSSIAVRARETAEALARPHGLDVAVREGVHEIDVGNLEGRSDPDAITEFLGVYRAWHAGNLDLAVPGGESARQLLDRFLPVVEQLTRDHDGEAVVLVSHGAAIRLAARTLASNVDSMFADAHSVPNAGAVTLDHDGTGWRCIGWDGVPALGGPGGAVPALGGPGDGVRWALGKPEG